MAEPRHAREKSEAQTGVHRFQIAVDSAQQVAHPLALTGIHNVVDQRLVVLVDKYNNLFACLFIRQLDYLAQTQSGIFYAGGSVFGFEALINLVEAFKKIVHRRKLVARKVYVNHRMFCPVFFKGSYG